LLAAIFSALNVLLLLLNTGITFLFSATSPIAIIVFGQAFANETGSLLPSQIADVIALVIVSFYAICYSLAKKNGAFVVVVLVLFSLDTLLLLGMMLLAFAPGLLLDVAFHAWVLYCLVKGTVAWIKLGRLPLDMLIEDAGEGLPVVQTIPIRPQSPKGKVLISQVCGELDIAIKRVLV